tara:strand:- start:7008 stop:7310 length:303 start_codon:yes stop_codon:yes gene_type:complete
MNQQEAKKYLPLIQALAEGKIIQYRDKESWYDVPSPNFVAYNEYRIKPQYTVKYANVYAYHTGFYHASRESVDNNCSTDRLAVLKITNTDGNITVEVQNG